MCQRFRLVGGAIWETSDRGILSLVFGACLGSGIAGFRHLRGVNLLEDYDQNTGVSYERWSKTDSVYSLLALSRKLGWLESLFEIRLG